MECCGTGLRGYSEASEQDSNIVYSFHLIPIYNRAQFVDKTDSCCSTSPRQWGVRTDDDMEHYQDKALAPLLWLLLALRMLACAYPGYAVPG